MEIRHLVQNATIGLATAVFARSGATKQSHSGLGARLKEIAALRSQ